MSTETTERPIDAAEMHHTATLMREQVADATPGPWNVDASRHGVYSMAQLGVAGIHGHVAEVDDHDADCGCTDAAHIASWHPLVALAVADWLDVTARDVGTSSLAYHAAAVVVRAYLGESAASAVVRAYLEPAGESA